MLGQWTDMVVVGILSGVGLSLLGIPLAFVLAVIAALLTFVPYFGPIVSAVPAIIVALTISWQAVLWVVVIYLICHAIEGYLVAPFVQRRTVELPPALTVLSMAILGAIFGVFGVIVATPLMATLLVIIREAYIEDVLGGTEIEAGPDRAARLGSEVQVSSGS
jgi:predicted PurR-regulated permease PerM